MKKTTIVEDQHKNEIYKKVGKTGDIVFLYLHKLGQTRRIGKVVKGKIIVERDRDKHMYQKIGAYGFNDKFLRTVPPSTELIVKEYKRIEKLRTTVDTILTEGQYLTFSRDGFETQIFLPLSKFQKFL